MNCPYCGKQIGGYVEMGSTAYTRVSQGCCPHCGRSMPANCKVGFASDSKPKKEWISDAEYHKQTSKHGLYGVLMAIGCILTGVSLIVGIFPSRPWLAFIVGGLYIALSILVAIAQYFVKYNPGTYNFRKNAFEHDANSISTPAALWISLFIDSMIAMVAASLPDSARVYNIIVMGACVAFFVISIVVGARKK